MNYLKLPKILATIVLLFLALLISPILTLTKVQAATEGLETSYEITYEVIDSENVKINYKIDISYEKKGSSVSAFILTVGENDVRDLNVKSGRGVTGSTKSLNNGTTVTLTFPTHKRLLSGDSTTIDMSYTTSDVIKKRGEVTDLIITGFSKDSLSNDAKLNVIAPDTLGKINYISTDKYKKNDLGTLEFESIPESGVVISFGDHQNYKFEFNYTIKNTSENVNQLASITIPFENKNQTLLFHEVSPSPYKAYTDNDNNYIIEYLTKPSEEINVKISGVASIFPKDGEKVEELSDEMKKIYTQQLAYWKLEDGEISEEFDTKMKSLESITEKSRAIYDYVLETLTYSETELQNSDRERYGASGSLQNPNSAICQEYTDLFVALARKYDIPSRSIAGYAYPTTGYELPPNTLHAWAQYFDDEQGWISVDPTWEDTSNGLRYFGNIGLNHFPIAIFGHDSIEPMLVLSFTPGEKTSDNLIIEPITDKYLSKYISLNDQSVAVIQIDTPSESLSGVQFDASVIVENQTDYVLKNLEIEIEGTMMNLDDKNLIVLPGTTSSFPFKLIERNILFKGEKVFNVNFTGITRTEELSREQDFKVTLTSPLLSGPIFIISIVIISLAMFVTTYTSIRKLILNRKKRSVERYSSIP